MQKFCRYGIINIKKITAIAVVYVLSTISPVTAQGKYKRTYTLQDHHFERVAAYHSGNAIMYINRDSLVNHLWQLANNSDYYETTRGKITLMLDTIQILANQSDITSISALCSDPELSGIVLSYFSKCVLNKQANVYDKRTNNYVKKIIVKKSQHSGRTFSAYSWYYYFLPDDKKEFMHRVEKSGTGIKFL